MNFLQHLSEAMKLRRLVGLDEEKVKNAFFANYLASLVLLRLQDLKGLVLINDKAHAKLDRYSDQMSDVNFWGSAIFHSKNPEVKNRLASGHADVLAVEAGRIMNSRVHWLMQVPLTAPERVSWIEVISSLLLLRHRFDVQSSYFKNLLYYLANWDKLRDSEKKRATSQAFMYLMQSDPKSALLPRLRLLQNSLMLKKITDVTQTIVGFKRIMEDNAIVGGDAGCTSTANVASADSTSLQGMFRLDKMSNTQVTKKGKYVFRDNKIIKKRPKKFKAKKFKAPKSLKMGASSYGTDQGDSGE